MYKSLYFFAAIYLTSHPALADFNGKVVKVLDGDTIDVLTLPQKEIKRVRLDGIDAPEKAQPFGQRSRQQLTTLIANKYVQVKSNKNDRYGRALGVVIDPNMVPGGVAITIPTNINKVQVMTGMAWAYRYHNKPSNAEYALLEQEAKEDKRGLWSLADPIEPWKWREEDNHRKHEN